MGRAASWAPVAVVAIPPIAWPNWVAIMVPMKERRSPAIAPIGAAPICSSYSLPAEFIASSSKREIAALRPLASGSMVACHPGSVSSIQSRRLIARGAVDETAGKSVASFSQISAISQALFTAVTSLVPRGCDPCAVTNFFPVSRTGASGSASVDPAPNKLLRPASGIPAPGFIPSCSNCC